MESSTAALVGGLIGVVLGAITVLAWRLSERDQGRTPQAPEPLVPPGAAAVLSVLRSSALVVGPDDQVLKATAPAHMMGLVEGTRVDVPELMTLIREVRRDGQIREHELDLRPRRGPRRQVAARVAPLGSRLVLVLVDDRTRERRVDAIRRDFVANVSHELKTPVGALNLLAEAVAEASDDPEAVQRFSARMRTESERLTRLVQQIIELSRLQGDDPLERLDPISVEMLAERAIDRVRVDAADKDVSVEFVGDRGLKVMGNAEQLIVALGNLVENAVAYSDSGARVAVSARPEGSNVDIVVTDHGVGIPADDIDRIFERFYRVDPARARATGGTGLGLSIVKHVAATHGGSVRVWSVEGEGSTFTIILPSYTEQLPDEIPPELEITPETLIGQPQEVP
ncbi:MAG: two-component system, OmpR family, sensor histidine kinase SenX3 [Nocardioidaceae bacterium]|jgi:two-component system sensor histidine kinase SenX3|nr:two-component system, OmpR family, sensor histidine kinase SenX3 [Nocardioidaceae bacterium]